MHAIIHEEKQINAFSLHLFIYMCLIGWRHPSQLLPTKHSGGLHTESWSCWGLQKEWHWYVHESGGGGGVCMASHKSVVTCGLGDK